MRDVSEIFDWLVNGAPGAANPVGALDFLGPRFRAMGLNVDHIACFVRTLHPHILGRTFIWKPGVPVQIRETSYSWLRSAEFANSAVARVIESGEYVRHRPGDARPAGEPELTFDANELGPDEFTDYLAAPIAFTTGQMHAISFATNEPGGFTDVDIAAIRHIIPPLSRVAEIFALQRTAATLLNTYVGRNAGEQIMAGKIQRGDTDTIGAVIWFSDLRGFTSLADQVPPVELIGMLNDLFEAQVPAIERNGGEILKFMGDGLLAIWPVDLTDATSTRRQCRAALEASREATAALTDLNAAKATQGGRQLKFGLALHIGDVAYGNIGGAGRLDFTCIGPAVNIAARLESLTAKLDRPVLVSAELAKMSGCEVEDIGAFSLKGVSSVQSVFAPVFGPTSVNLKT